MISIWLGLAIGSKRHFSCNQSWFDSDFDEYLIIVQGFFCLASRNHEIFINLTQEKKRDA